MTPLCRQRPGLFFAALLLLLDIPGCLLVRTSEHIITIRADGSGEGIIHLIDIRSTAPSDSLVKRDFDELMQVYGAAKVEEFETYGRTITNKRLRVHGDTLMAEITYRFNSLDAIDGLRVTEGEMTLTFGPDRQVTRTNGKMSRTEKGGTLITWERDAERLVYEVREKQTPVSTSLAPLYRKYTR